MLIGISLYTCFKDRNSAFQKLYKLLIEKERDILFMNISYPKLVILWMFGTIKGISINSSKLDKTRNSVSNFVPSSNHLGT